MQREYVCTLYTTFNFWTSTELFYVCWWLPAPNHIQTMLKWWLKCVEDLMKLNAITKSNLTFVCLRACLCQKLDLHFSCKMLFWLTQRFIPPLKSSRKWLAPNIRSSVYCVLALNSMPANELSKNLDIVTFNFSQSQGNSLFPALFGSAQR